MHTTGTTTPDGVHQLAPGLGERRFMLPPSGGQFKLPAELQTAQTPQVAHEPQAALPGHAVNLDGAMHMQGTPHMQVAAAVPQLAVSASQVGWVNPNAENVIKYGEDRFGAHYEEPIGRPPAPAGYQSAPMGVPPGMVPHTVQHAAPQGLSGMQPQGFMAVNTPGGFQPAMVPPTTTTNTTSWPRPLGSMEVAPPTHTYPGTAAPWPPVQPHPLTPSPFTASPGDQQPHVHQRATLTPGTVLRLEGPQDVIEAAIGMLMLRGLHVTVVPS